RQRCGWRRVRLDAAGRRAWQPGGAYLDLSGIAKGHGVDRAAQALEHLGVRDYLVEVGGELRAGGARPDRQPWRVAVEVPDGSADHALALALHDRAIATSGDYRRYREGAAGRYAHTLDPRSGRPVDNGVASVTVVHRSCMQADALATALTVLGERDGLAYAQRHAVAAVFILRAAGRLRRAASGACAALAGGCAAEDGAPARRRLRRRAVALGVPVGLAPGPPARRAGGGGGARAARPGRRRRAGGARQPDRASRGPG